MYFLYKFDGNHFVINISILTDLGQGHVRGQGYVLHLKLSTPGRGQCQGRCQGQGHDLEAETCVEEGSALEARK